MPAGKPSGTGLKGAFSKFLHSGGKPKNPAELVRLSSDILTPLVQQGGATSEKALDDVERHLEEMVFKLYGDSDTHPNPEEVAVLCQEIFKGTFLSTLIRAVPLIKESSRQPAVQIVAGVQSQARQVSSQYLQAHTDVLDLMLRGYEDTDVALFYGCMLRDCLRHQEAARHVLRSPSFLSLFKYIELPQFEVASDAAATFKELLLRHKSTAAEFLVQNHKDFFSEFNKLLESEAYVTRRTAAKLLSDLLQDRSYSAVLKQYASDVANLRPVMNLLKDSSKTIQLDGYQIFRTMAMHPDKSDDIRHVLSSNKEKLIKVLTGLKPEKGTDAELEQFERDKKQLLDAILAL